MAYHRMFNMSNTTGTTSTAVMAYPSGASSSHSVSSGVRVAEFLVLCVVFRRSLFVQIYQCQLISKEQETITKACNNAYTVAGVFVQLVL
jgi:hypothetical protein